VDTAPDPLLLRKSCSAGNRSRGFWVCSQELWLLDHRGGLFITETLSSLFAPFEGMYKKTNPVALSPRANYIDWATATCRRNLMSTFVDRGVSRGQRGGSPTVVNFSFLDRSRYFFFQVEGMYIAFYYYYYYYSYYYYFEPKIEGFSGASDTTTRQHTNTQKTKQNKLRGLWSASELYRLHISHKITLRKKSTQNCNT
jgi:hypothetical protein